MGAGAEPKDGVFEQFVLDGGGKYLVPMSHVHIQHLISGISPDDGDVTAV